MTLCIFLRMPKTKPNEKCPCDSGIKYKKCCLNIHREKKLDDEAQFEECMIAAESMEIANPSLKRLSEYFLDRYNRQSIDISDTIDCNNIKSIQVKYKSRRVFLLLARNPTNDIVFSKAGSADTEDIMVIYRSHYQSFNYESEYDDAIKEIHKWIS